MWVFTKDGFVSVVQHRDDHEMLMVRARLREQLESVAAKVNLDPEDIVESPRADYRYRIVVPRFTWAEYMVDAVFDLDYDNVKSNIAGSNPAYKRSMMDVWSVMHRLQTASVGAEEVRDTGTDCSNCGGPLFFDGTTEADGTRWAVCDVCGDEWDVTEETGEEAESLGTKVSDLLNTLAEEMDDEG